MQFNDISKVRDFAYEETTTTLPPVKVVPRPPSPRYLHLRVKDKEDSDEEDKSIPRTWYIDSSGTGVSPTSRFRKKGDYRCPDTRPNSPTCGDDASQVVQELEDTHVRVRVRHGRESKDLDLRELEGRDMPDMRESQGVDTRATLLTPVPEAESTDEPACKKRKVSL